MLRREALTTLHACYAFVEVFEGRPGRLWDSAMRELTMVRNLLPVLQADLTAGWHGTVACSDAAPGGLGVARRRLGTATVASCARFSERWRFKVAGAQAAREQSLACGSASERQAAAKNGYRAADADGLVAESPIDDLEPVPDFPVAPLEVTLLDSGEGPCIAPEEDTKNPGEFAVRFEEVPAEITDSPAWRPSAAVQISGGANILFLEGEGLCLAYRHLLRDSGCLGSRMMIIVDNLPLALGAVKGRAKSRHLRRCLGRVCALSVATGSKLYVRWVASERNASDPVSRGRFGWFSGRRVFHGPARGAPVHRRGGRHGGPRKRQRGTAAAPSECTHSRSWGADVHTAGDEPGARAGGTGAGGARLIRADHR